MKPGRSPACARAAETWTTSLHATYSRWLETAGDGDWIPRLVALLWSRLPVDRNSGKSRPQGPFYRHSAHPRHSQTAHKFYDLWPAWKQVTSGAIRPSLSNRWAAWSGKAAPGHKSEMISVTGMPGGLFTEHVRSW